MNQEFKGLNNLELDQPKQVEFNRRKNVQQDQRLASLEANVNQLITQVPAGYLPRVYYGLTRGNETYRFLPNAILNIQGLQEGGIGDAYGIMSTAEVVSYINAIAVRINEFQLKVVIQGDYTINATEFNLINQRTGEILPYTLENVLSLQPASYLGSYDATANAGKQITVLNDIEFNDVNITFASVDYSGDGVYNWVKIGNFINGSDGRSIYALTQNTAQPVFQVARINDLVVAGEPVVYQNVSLATGDIKLIASLDPIVLEDKGNIRGAQGLTGATGQTGQDGQDGITPEIIDGYWHIGSVNTGVKAEGVDGANGEDGQSFAIQSGLFSVPSNQGKAGNTDPQGNSLNILPTLPAIGISGKGYIVYDPITTPLTPYYDLYWANDGDTSWGIIHPFNGSNGRDGTNGYTPYIQNNNWYINGQNTGVQATGSQGPKGDPGINFMAAWVSENEYYIDDVVTYDGSAYICIQNHSGATTTPDLDTTNWAIFVSKGDTGAAGQTGATGATGATPNISMTATALPADSAPTVTKSGTLENPIFTLGIPGAGGGGGSVSIVEKTFTKNNFYTEIPALISSNKLLYIKIAPNNTSSNAKNNVVPNYGWVNTLNSDGTFTTRAYDASVDLVYDISKQDNNGNVLFLKYADGTSPGGYFVFGNDKYRLQILDDGKSTELTRNETVISSGKVEFYYLTANGTPYGGSILSSDLNFRIIAVCLE